MLAGSTTAASVFTVNTWIV
uniref:Uncharacterized protein n=1 Tax=Anguilla anguilla TaxID=7936 RepID=A0A0E9UM15_ANGAN